MSDSPHADAAAASAEPAAPKPLQREGGGGYGAFNTDGGMEKDGIWHDFSLFRVKLRRAGGDNNKFAKIFEQKMAPYQHLLDAEMLENDKARAILMEVVAEALVSDWEVNLGTVDEPNLVKGIEDPANGMVLPFNVENIIMVFKTKPGGELFTDLWKQSQRLALYRTEVAKGQAGN
jgi:hypothetical protein